MSTEVLELLERAEAYDPCPVPGCWGVLTIEKPKHVIIVQCTQNPDEHFRIATHHEERIFHFINGEGKCA